MNYKQVKINLTPSHYSELETEALNNGMSIAQLVRHKLGIDLKDTPKALQRPRKVRSDKKEIVKAEADLLEQVKAKYEWLRHNEDEVKRLVIKKWTKALTDNILSEMQRVIENLNSKVTAIAERYEQTLSEINNEVSEYEKKVMAVSHAENCIGCEACAKICPRNCYTHAPANV